MHQVTADMHSESGETALYEKEPFCQTKKKQATRLASCCEGASTRRVKGMIMKGIV